MSFSFEHGRHVAQQRRSEGIPAQKEGNNDVETLRAHKKAKKILESPVYKVSPNEFVKKYGKEVVDSDTAFAQAKRQEFEASDTERQKEAYVLAEIFEAILLTEGQESKWLGDDVKILKASDYDDIRNRVDLIAEWRGQDAHTLGLAVDVTFGPTTLEKKFQHIQDDVDKGRLGRLKYAHSEQTSVPRVVIGMSKETVKELMSLWLEEDIGALAEHPIQRVLLEQIFSQLQTISRYARANGNAHIADAYERSLAPIRRLLSTKMSIPLDTMQSDSVSLGIAQQLEKRFTTLKR
ncbi:MAG: hypothetical protein JWM46_673 [Candidatus Kaiserbacteria bacterium]|nr:hypothetical protein [Candidatus Kaiserbacteria bacterium]